MAHSKCSIRIYTIITAVIIVVLKLGAFKALSQRHKERRNFSHKKRAHEWTLEGTKGGFCRCASVLIM